jgi:hypothetical protein
MFFRLLSRLGARNLSDCYRHVWIRSIPAHYVLFASFVFVVFIVNVVYVLVTRRRQIGNYLTRRFKGLPAVYDYGSSADSGDDSTGLRQWNERVSGRHAVSFGSVIGQGNHEIRPLLTGPVGPDRLSAGVPKRHLNSAVGAAAKLGWIRDKTFWAPKTLNLTLSMLQLASCCSTLQVLRLTITVVTILCVRKRELLYTRIQCRWNRPVPAAFKRVHHLSCAMPRCRGGEVSGNVWRKYMRTTT